jgi:hypothetical protein
VNPDPQQGLRGPADPDVKFTKCTPAKSDGVYYTIYMPSSASQALKLFGSLLILQLYSAIMV